MRGGTLLSINTWVFDPTMTFEQRVLAAKAAGFSALEINLEEPSDEVPLLDWETTEVHLSQMLKVMQSHGLQASSICTELFWKYSLSSPDDTECEKSLDLGYRMIDQAASLGAKSIVVIPGVQNTPPELGSVAHPQSSSDTWKRAVERVRILGEKAEKSGVVVGIENVHFNSFLMSPLELLAFLEEVNHPFVKAHLDIGNANIAGQPHDWISVLGEQICAVHLKDSVQWQSDLQTFRPLGFGTVDWGLVKASMKHLPHDVHLIVEQSFNRKTSSDDFLRLLHSSAKHLTERG